MNRGLISQCISRPGAGRSDEPQTGRQFPACRPPVRLPSAACLSARDGGASCVCARCRWRVPGRRPAGAALPLSAACLALIFGRPADTGGGGGASHLHPLTPCEIYILRRPLAADFTPPHASGGPRQRPRPTDPLPTTDALLRLENSPRGQSEASRAAGNGQCDEMTDRSKGDARWMDGRKVGRKERRIDAYWRDG